MNISEFRFTDGTSALKPDCSRYSNENERIIDFKRAAADWESQVDYRRLAHARHATKKDKIHAQCIAVADMSRSVHDVRTGSLEGTPFNLQDGWKMKVYGCLYTAMAVAAIFAAV